MQDEPENQEDQTQDPTTEEVEAQTETPAPDDDDPDAQALKDALAEAEAEEAAAKQAVENAEKEAQPEKSEAAPETKDGDKAAETKPDAGEQPMIPKARFDEVADRANRASAQVLYLQGQLEAYRSGQKTEPKAEEPTPETTIDELEAQRDAIWKKADDGDLTLSEARKQERALDRRIAEIERAAQPKPEEKPGPAGQDLYLREKTAEIQRQHPYVGKINALPEADQDAAWSFLEKKAEAAMTAAGSPLNQQDPYSVLQFRQTLGRLADQYGPKLLDEPAQPPNPKPNGGQPSDRAEARKEKLEMADRMPPDISDMGTAGDAPQYTEAQILSMSEEELDALPASVRQKIAGDSFTVS